MKAVVREIEHRIEHAANAAQRLSALLELANCHASGFRNREGLRAARQALELARHRGDSLSMCRALSIATLCHYQRCDYVAAVATGLDAVAAYSEGDLRGRSSAQQSVALALFCVGARELAEATARRAIADALAGADERCEAAAREVLGMILGQAEQFDAARREFRRAAAVYGRRGDDARVKKLTASLGHTYRDQGNLSQQWGRAPQARFYWKQALRVYRVALGVSESESIDALILGAVGECELRQGDIGSAAGALRRALGSGVDCPTILAPCHLWESHVLAASGDMKAAERACEAARRAAERLEHGDLLVACLAAQAKLADRMGRFETANDLEIRARDVAADRALHLATVREQLAQSWDRYITAARSSTRSAA